MDNVELRASLSCEIDNLKLRCRLSCEKGIEAIEIEEALSDMKTTNVEDMKAHESSRSALSEEGVDKLMKELFTLQLKETDPGISMRRNFIREWKYGEFYRRGLTFDELIVALKERMLFVHGLHVGRFENGRIIGSTSCDGSCVTSTLSEYSYKDLLHSYKVSHIIKILYEKSLQKFKRLPYKSHPKRHWSISKLKEREKKQSKFKCKMTSQQKQLHQHLMLAGRRRRIASMGKSKLLAHRAKDALRKRVKRQQIAKQRTKIDILNEQRTRLRNKFESIMSNQK